MFSEVSVIDYRVINYLSGGLIMSDNFNVQQKIELFSINNVTSGMKVSQDIKDKKGFLLVKADMELNEHLINKLRQFGITDVPIYVTYQESNVPVNNINLNQIFREQLADYINSSLLSFIKNEKYTNRVIALAMDITKDDALISHLIELKTIGHNVLLHSINVFTLSLLMGIKNNFPTDRLITLAHAAALHDIGKKFLPVEILERESSLNEGERKVFEQHPLFTFEYLQSLNKFNNEVARICYQHHEKNDGSGYPNNLTRDNIHKMAQIISLVDSFVSIIGENTTNNRLGFANAIEYLEGAGGVYFDLENSKYLLEEICVYKVNDWVVLSNDDIGIVSKIFDSTPLRPVVTVFFDNFKQKYSFPKQIDLTTKNYANLFIKSVL